MISATVLELVAVFNCLFSGTMPGVAANTGLTRSMPAMRKSLPTSFSHGEFLLKHCFILVGYDKYLTNMAC